MLDTHNQRANGAKWAMAFVQCSISKHKNNTCAFMHACMYMHKQTDRPTYLLLQSIHRPLCYAQPVQPVWLVSSPHQALPFPPSCFCRVESSREGCIPFRAFSFLRELVLLQLGKLPQAVSGHCRRERCCLKEQWKWFPQSCRIQREEWSVLSSSELLDSPNTWIL